MEIKDDICPRCSAKNSFEMDMHTGVIVCANCAHMAQESIIDDKGGNRPQSHIRDPMKAGEGNNLGSNLIKINKDGNAVRAKYSEGSYNQTSTERNYEEINKILSNKDITKLVIEETINIYDQVIKELIIKRRNFKALVCAMYYIASKKLKMSKSFKDISLMFDISEAKIKKEYNYIKNVVNNVLTVEQQNDTLKNYIRTFCEENKENDEYKSLAILIAKNINESSILEGKNTNTITGLSLYIAMKLEKTNSVTKDKICERRVNKNTLNKVYKQIKDYFDVIIPEKYKDKIKYLILNN